MRIIGGTAGGRRLAAPPDGTRPTTDRVREALFSSLDSHVVSDHRAWSDVRVLDLFAGSGAVGLEAMSRGARHVTLVERDRRCLSVLRTNVAAVDPRARVVAADAFEWVPGGDSFDIIYVDPPYAVDDDDIRALLSRLARTGAFAMGAVIVVERSQRSASPWPAEGFEPLRDRTYGDTRLWYGQASPREGASVEEEA